MNALIGSLSVLAQSNANIGDELRLRICSMRRVHVNTSNTKGNNNHVKYHSDSISRSSSKSFSRNYGNNILMGKLNDKTNERHSLRVIANVQNSRNRNVAAT